MRILSEGFEAGDTNRMRNIGGVAAASITTTAGQYRSGARGLLMSNNSGADAPWGMLWDAAASEFYARAAFLQEGYVGSWYPLYISNTDTPCYSFGLLNTYTLRLLVGSTTTDIALPFLVSTGVWYLYEVYIKVASSGGRITIKMDGVQVYDFTGNTLVSGNTTMNSFIFRRMASGVTTEYDDLAVNDTSNTDGLGDTGWCGDGHIVCLTANGNGDQNDWTASAGSNYQCVDDVPNNGDTDYVVDSTATHRDMYNMTDWDDSGNKTVLRVWAEARARDTVAAGGQIKIGVKTHGTVYLGSALTLLTTYTQALIGTYYKVNPNTSSAWTNTEADAVQFVVETQ